MEKIEKLLLFIIGQFKGEHLEGGDANTESEEIMDKLKVHCKHVLADRQLGEAGEGDGGGVRVHHNPELHLLHIRKHHS